MSGISGFESFSERIKWQIAEEKIIRLLRKTRIH
jgi:hypothetical protein